MSRDMASRSTARPFLALRGWIQVLYISCSLLAGTSSGISGSVEKAVSGSNVGAPLQLKMLHPLSMEAWEAVQERRHLLNPSFTGQEEFPAWARPGTEEYLHLLHESSRRRADYVRGRPERHGRGLVEAAQARLLPLPPPLQGLLHYASVPIGTPAQELLLMVDTGSNLLWSNCDCSPTTCDRTSTYYTPSASSTSRRIACSSPLCSADLVDSDTACTDQCQYTVQYLDNSSTSGTLFLDVLNADASLPVIVGCGSDQTGNLLDTATIPNTGISYGGIMGLGQGPSILNTLADSQQIPARALSQCIGGENESGYLILGDNFVPSGPGSGQTRMRSRQVYIVGLNSILFGNQALPGFEADVALYNSTTGAGGIVLDTGSAVSHFPRSFTSVMVDALGTLNTGLLEVQSPRRANGEPLFPICFDGRITDIKDGMPDLAFAFVPDSTNAPSTWSVPPDNYLFEVQGSGGFRSCLGIIDDGLARETIILGQNFQKNFVFTYDLTRRIVAWSGKPMPCDASARGPGAVPAPRLSTSAPSQSSPAPSSSDPPPSPSTLAPRSNPFAPLGSILPSPPPSQAAGSNSTDSSAAIQPPLAHVNIILLLAALCLLVPL